MISVKRLHLINWMYYSKLTVEFERGNLLTGITGSGKSSLVDAMQVILLGQTGGRSFFNKSATGTRSDRTLVTYLRGKYHDKEYKRPDRAFSSYLFLDFFDEVNRETFSFGVVFDLPRDDNWNHNYFRLDAAFDPAWAMDGRRARTRQEFRQALERSHIKHKPFPTNTAYQKDLLARCGIYDEQFFRIFKTAVAYVPLDNIEDFITKNICHVEEEVDVEKMRASVLDYKRMQAEMEEFCVRRDDMERIAKIDSDYQDRLRRLREQNYIWVRAQVDQLRQQSEAAWAETAQLEEEHTETNRRISVLEQEKDDWEKQKEIWMRELANDPDARHKQEVIEKINLLQGRIDAARRQGREQAERLAQRAAVWARCLHEVSPLQAQAEDWPWDRNFRLQAAFSRHSQRTVQNLPGLKPDALAADAEEAKDLKQLALLRTSEWEKAQSADGEALEKARARLREYEAGRKQYPVELLQMKARLERQLQQKTGQTVQLSILADLLEIQDKRWTNVIEGYLHRQRLFLLVEPRYYKLAVRLFRDYSRENACYDYSIIDTSGLLAEQRERPFKVLPNSLANVISTDHEGAKTYIAYLLGRVERVEAIEEVTGRRTAVTADGMLYRGFSVSRMRPALWRDTYIGRDSIARQIKNCQEEIAALKEALAHREPLLEAFGKIREAPDLSPEFVEAVGAAVQSLRDIPAMEQQIEQLDRERARIDTAYSDNLKRQIEQAEKRLKALAGNRDELVQRAAVLEARQKAAEERIEALEPQIAEKQQEFAQKYGAFENDHPQTVQRYEMLLRQKESAEKLQADYFSAKRQTETELSDLRTKFARQTGEFNQAHRSAAISTDIADAGWKQAYEKMKAIDIAQYRKGVEDARRQAEEIFQNGFINQIKGNIDKVQSQIRELNRALQDFTFGRVRYRFKCEPTDKTEYRPYYDLIMSSALDGISLENFMEQRENQLKYEALIQTMFKMIAERGSDAAARRAAEENIEIYKSFKTYLKFDLVEVDQSGQEHPLSRTMGSKSGGERQTPFYIAILASLMKTYHMERNANSLRLVVFDEAFDKIDTSRIEECVAMLRQVGFQFIIVAPNDKAPYIAGNVERTLVVTKPNDYTSHVSLYQKRLEEPA